MQLPKVTIIDYGSGNLLSVKRALEHCGADVSISSNKSEILNSERIVLPGVGAFPNAMNNLNELDLISILQDFSISSKPFLAICLGMQLLFEESSEISRTTGLNIIKGKVVTINESELKKFNLKIPHIGWSSILKTKVKKEWSNTLLKDNEEGDSMYFVHSFKTVPDQSQIELANTIYGNQKITAVINFNNIWGCQFHPEKSGTLGLKILKNFIEL